jgi:hypothetical protein
MKIFTREKRVICQILIFVSNRSIRLNALWSGWVVLIGILAQQYCCSRFSRLTCLLTFVRYSPSDFHLRESFHCDWRRNEWFGRCHLNRPCQTILIDQHGKHEMKRKTEFRSRKRSDIGKWFHLFQFIEMLRFFRWPVWEHVMNRSRVSRVSATAQSESKCGTRQLGIARSIFCNTRS